MSATITANRAFEADPDGDSDRAAPDATAVMDGGDYS